MRCDTHVHIVGPIGRYPQLPSRTYLAGVAPLDELRRRGAERGVSRFVIVQASFYGADSTLLLESLDILGPNGRGVAVIDPAATPKATLAEYARRGVRGLRLNLYSTAAGREVKRVDGLFAPLADIAGMMGWHVEVIASIDQLLAAADVLARSAVPVVIDHYGVYGRATPQSEAGRRLLELLGQPNVWVKLSAPYRVSDDALATRPDPAWLAAIVKAAPGRCVWGSDWPHTPHQSLHGDAARPLPYRPLSYTALVDDFLAALGNAELAQAIMTDNPARLYGFSAKGLDQGTTESRARPAPSPEGRGVG
jgi:predicted TIM-barrel fold metal-dependent hydrolase